MDLKIRDKYKECRYCHSTENLTIDHIIPKSKGGENSKRNYQPLCNHCNAMKGNMTDKQVASLFRWFKYIEESRKEPLNW